MPRKQFLDFAECLELNSGYLVTLNMQHLYECRRSGRLRDAIFASSDARLCIDGRGAQKLFERATGRSLPLVAGNAFLAAWLRQSAGHRVLVIGSTGAVVSKVAALHPDLRIEHNDSHFTLKDDPDAAGIADALLERHGRGWDGIVLALGVPKQEIIARALARDVPDIPIFCIGGSLEMIAGLLPRSPALVQRLGLEGVWRLVLEPSGKRIERLVLSYLNFFDLMARPKRFAVLFGGEGDRP